MPKKEYNIVLLPGDGTGPELMEQGVKVLEAVQEVTRGLKLSLTKYEAGASLYKYTGVACPLEVFNACKEADAIYKGPMGLPDVRYRDGTEINVDILLRQGLDMYANIRPVKLWPGVSTILKNKAVGEIDYVVVRENSEGLYASCADSVAETGNTTHSNGIILRDEVAVDSLVITRKGTERIVKYAYELARKRKGAPIDGKKRVTCVDKSNILKSYAFFRKIFDEVATGYPDIDRDYAYIDAVTQWMVRRPEWFDVIVVENMFGDIITDLGSATVGSIGIGPSANIGNSHAMFEPIHGSAPKYAGKNIVNPIGQILAGKMMLEWIGEKYDDNEAIMAAVKIENAVSVILAEGKTMTYDIGGTSKTSEVGNAIANEIKKMS